MKSLYRVLTPALICVGAAAAHAQALQPPPRSVEGVFGGGPVDPKRLHHELTSQFQLLAGYDDNLAPLGGQKKFDRAPTAYMGLADASLRYWVGKAARSVEVKTHSHMDMYAGDVQLDPMFAHDLSATGKLAINRFTALSVSQFVQRTPYTSLGLFGALGRGAGANGTAGTGAPPPGTDVIRGRTRTSTTSASLARQWRRASATFSYNFNASAHENRNIFHNHAHAASAAFTRSIGRLSGGHMALHHSESELFQAGKHALIRTEGVDAGLSYGRRVSRSRAISITGGGGVQYSDKRDSVHVKHWAPTAYAAARVDLFRSWSLSVDYRESLAVLPAPVFASNSFLAHAVGVTAGGTIGRRLEAVLNTSYSNGVVAGKTPTSGGGSYASYTGTSELTIHLTRWWSAFLSASHSTSRLDDTAMGILETFSNMDRNSFRVGLAAGLPLFGASAAPGGRP